MKPKERQVTLGGETYPVTDYVIAPAVPGSSLSRRDGAEFCN